jgi:hypothetical protein
LFIRMPLKRLGRHLLPVAALAAALAAPSAAQADGQVKAGVAVLDGTYHVGNSAGQYATTRDSGYGDVDPHAQQVKNQASYGVESRESVRALVVQGSDGNLVALLSDDHYIPQDALWRRTAQLLDQATGGLVNTKNLTMSVTHNHSSPSYSSFDWGVWAFQDVFDFRFFDYYARQNRDAVLEALKNLKPVRVSATVSHFSAFHKNPMGPGWADDNTPAGFPRSYTDHDLSVVHFESIGRRGTTPLATLVNLGQHPEDLNGYNLISGEYPAVTERFVDRAIGGVTILTQNATGTSEVEQERWHPVHDRALFDHAQYQQMEWAARLLADGIIADVRDIRRQRPNRDDKPTPYGGTSYHDRFIPWMSRFPVAMDDRWFPGPVSHPYPGVSSCRTDAALQGNPRVPLAGLPDCVDVPAGNSLSPLSPLGDQTPGISTDTFEQLGIPIPENYSAPSYGGLEDTLGVHMQAFRLGEILFTVCSCEQWVDQSYNIKTRTDTQPGNEYLGYDPTSPDAHPTNKCTKNSDATWSCTVHDAPDAAQTHKLPDKLIAHLQAQIRNDASGWDDPSCNELGCGYQAESESTDAKKIRGNYTHDDTPAKRQSNKYARDHGYKLTATISMANDYNGYIATYRDYMSHDHYRKALTGWGPHSSDYFATRLTQMGHALKGDAAARKAIAGQTEPGNADPAWAPMVAKEVADQAAEDAKVRAVSEAVTQAVRAYELTLPDDGGADQVVEPKDIERFDSATFTWHGGNNYTDNPVVEVQRKVKGAWVPFADQSGEVPVTLQYPESSPDADPAAIAKGVLGYRAGGQTWKWTATFEAFVSQFAQIDARGAEYTATPPGTYQFVVHGKWRKNGTEAPYTRVSREFEVKPWSGLTVEGAQLDSAGRVTFRAGPSHQIQERRVRRTARPALAEGDPPIEFTVGPVDYPDTAKDQKATGARFLNSLRGYSADSMTEVEHYCLDCSFRPWLDASGAVTAVVTITRANGTKVKETLSPNSSGAFTTRATLAAGDSAGIAVADAWGNTAAGPLTFPG